MKSDKKGQQMTLGTIIAIVLGIAVLVFLIWGFSAGWTNLWDQVSGRTSSSNVELRISDCELDCENGERSAWCNEKKDLRYFESESEKVKKISGTCYKFSTGLIDGFDGEKAGFNKCDAFPTCE